MKCTTVLHGGVCHRTSIPQKDELEDEEDDEEEEYCYGLVGPI